MTSGNKLQTSDQMFAAEYALGLLEDVELLEARARLPRDPAFAGAVENWNERLAPLLDEVAGAEPGNEVWHAIERRIADGSAHESAEVIQLQSRVRRWQWTAGITSAAAAVALAFLAFAPGSGPAPTPAPTVAATDPLMATVPIGDTGLRLDVTYMPESERMLVTAIGLTADGVHDHELWLVPAEGDLQSLGVVVPGEVVSVDLPEEIARNILNGSQVLLTREPLGGKPEGQDAGPVVAEGAFSQV